MHNFSTLILPFNRIKKKPGKLSIQFFRLKKLMAIAVLLLSFTSAWSQKQANSTANAAMQNQYFVSLDGNDNNNGSIDQPFRTIQKAADVAQAGDIVEIREGIYREKVTLKRSGSTDSPITFQAYNGENVIISTCDLLSGWTASSGDINLNGSPDTDVWEATMDWDAGDHYPAGDQGRWAVPNEPVYNNTMFVDGVLRYVAREKAETNPVYVDNWGIIPHHALKHEGFTAPELAGWGDDFWNGAKVCHHTSDWSSQYSVIEDYKSSDGTVTFKDKLTYFPSQKQRFGYYIFGTIRALDKTHEWYKVTSKNKIYYKAMPGIDPNNLEIEMKRRDYTFDLAGKSNITIKGIVHRGGGPSSTSDCNGFIFQGNEVYGIAENGYGHLRITGNNIQIRDNYFHQTFASVMGTGGDRWDIVNNLFEDISYHIPATGLDIDISSSRFLISHNTFSGVGRGAFRFYPFKSIVSYNCFEKYCRNSWDTAAIDGDVSGGQGGGSLVHHNVFRDAPQYNAHQRGPGTNGSGFAGLYSGLELTVYRNIFLNAGRWPIINSRLNFHNFYHNTMAMNKPNMDIASCVESSFLNNLQVGVEDIVTPNFRLEGNVDFKASDFVNLEADDVRLSDQSAAIDQGILIPGVNDDFKGAAPDAGALEFGDTIWKFGHDFENPPSVTYDYAPPAGANIVGDGAFTNASEWNFVKNSSLYNPNTWNHGALGPNGTYSLKLVNDGLIEAEFDNLKPEKTYEIGVEARLVSPDIKANSHYYLYGNVSQGNHRGENYMTGLDDGDFAGYEDINFGDGTLFDHVEVSFARLNSLTTEEAERNTLELRLKSKRGDLLATLKYRTGVSDSWVWTTSEMVNFPTGQQKVFLVPVGPESGSMRIASFRFYKKNIEINKQLSMGVEGHGYDQEISYVGKGEWIDRYEKMLFHTGSQVDKVKLFFKNDGPYDAYVSRVSLKEVDDYENLAVSGTSVQSSTQSGNESANAHDGKRDDYSAITNKEEASFWQMELSDAHALKALRISAASNENALEKIKVSLGTNDPRLGGTPLLSREYQLNHDNLTNGKSLYVSVFEWIKDEMATNIIPMVNYVRVERLDGEKLALSEVEAISFDTDVDEFAEEVKNENQWQYTFAYDINPTLLTLINDDINALEDMRVVVRNNDGTVVWEKTYDGDHFNLPKNEHYEIPGNELSKDGKTRLASVLGRSISVEKIGSNLNLQDFKIFDGSQVAPEGNLALDGKATQSSNHYRSHGYASNAINGYIFPNNDFTTTARSEKPWWELELAQVSDIDQIVMYNRNPEGAAVRIGNFTVSVLNDARETIWTQNYSYSSGDLKGGKSLVINTDHENARYVRVQCQSNSTFLHLAEVQVWPKNEESIIRTLPAKDAYNFDIGPVNQEVQPGWIGVNPLTSGDVWWSNRPNGLDHGASTWINDVNRDFATAASPTTLNVRLPNGKWRVTVTTGDEASAHDGFHLIAEDVVIADKITTAKNSFSDYTKEINLTDGILNLSVSDVNGDDASWVWNRLSIDTYPLSSDHLKGKEENIRVYPNPASEFINIDLSAMDMNSPQEIILFDALGKIHEQITVNNAGVFRFDVSSCNEGVYFVKAQESVVKVMVR